MATLLLHPIALLRRHRRVLHHPLLDHLYHHEEEGVIVVEEVMTERIIPVGSKKITPPNQEITHAHHHPIRDEKIHVTITTITEEKEATAEIAMIEGGGEDDDIEVPREEIIMTTTNHNKILPEEESESTAQPPLVPQRMIPQVISRVVGGHLLVITIEYYVMLDWGRLDG